MANTATTLAATREQNYVDVSRLVNKLAWNYVKTHGGDFDEVLAQANEAYVMAAASYVPEKSRFTTWVYQQVWFRLRKIRRGRSVRTVELTEEALEQREAKTNWLECLMAEISDDARTVVRVLVESPTDVLKALFGARPCGVKARKKLLRHMRREHGWSIARVLSAFSEIKEALNG